MNAKEFFYDFLDRHEIQKKYQNKDVRQLIFEVIEKYAEHKQLRISGVSDSLPAGWRYYDENGSKCKVIGTVNNWVVVQDVLAEKTWAEPLEFVMALYEESKGNNA